METKYKARIREELIVGQVYTCYVYTSIDGCEFNELELEYLGTIDNQNKFLDRKKLEIFDVNLNDVFDAGVYIEYTVTKDKISIVKNTVPDNVDKKLLTVRIEDVVKTMYEKAKAAYVEHM